MYENVWKWKFRACCPLSLKCKKLVSSETEFREKEFSYYFSYGHFPSPSSSNWNDYVDFRIWNDVIPMGALITWKVKLSIYGNLPSPSSYTKRSNWNDNVDFCISIDVIQSKRWRKLKSKVINLRKFALPLKLRETFKLKWLCGFPYLKWRDPKQEMTKIEK